MAVFNFGMQLVDRILFVVPRLQLLEEVGVLVPNCLVKKLGRFCCKSADFPTAFVANGKEGRLWPSTSKKKPSLQFQASSKHREFYIPFQPYCSRSPCLGDS
jgi:hypothetical protein